MAIFPLAPDQTIAQMWSNGVWEHGKMWCEWTAIVPIQK